MYDDCALEYTEFNSELSYYIENEFLERSINESVASITNKIKTLINDKGEDITQYDINNVYNDIKNEEDKETKKKQLTSLLSELIGITLDVVGLVGKFSGKWKIASVVLGVINSVFGACIKYNLKTDNYYNNLVKVEAKAKANLEKAKASQKSKDIEENEKIIDAVEKIKETRRRALAVKKADMAIAEAYEGNTVKNYEYIQVLEDVDRVCRYNLDKLEKIDSSIDDFIKAINNSRLVERETDRISRALNTDLKHKEIDATNTYNMLKNKSSQFNNIYSRTSMENKEKINNKFISYLEKMSKYKEKYESKEFYNSYNNALDKYKDNKELYSRLKDNLEIMIELCIEAMNENIANIDKFSKLLKIDKIKNSKIYKFLNKK